MLQKIFNKVAREEHWERIQLLEKAKANNLPINSVIIKMGDEDNFSFVHVDITKDDRVLGNCLKEPLTTFINSVLDVHDKKVEEIENMTLERALQMLLQNE